MSAPRRLLPILAFAIAVGFLTAGCDTPMAQVGQDAAGLDASSADPGRAGSPLPFGAPAESALPPADVDVATDAVADALREIEEADVLKIVDTKMYVLNQYKGLIVIDVANADQPQVLGSVELRGLPVEMYVVGTQAYVVLSADFGYPVLLAEPDASGRFAPPPQPEFTGSQVAIINVADPAAPAVLGKINLAGYADQSRRVGSVLYVAGRNFTSYESRAASGVIASDAVGPGFYEEERGFVASINIADPANIQPVDRETFRGGAIEMHVTDAAIFAGSIRYDFNDGRSFTRVQYVDITDPAGTIVLRDSIDVPGAIRNRFYMDEHEATFRICTENNGFGFSSADLYTYSVTNADDMLPLGHTQIIQGESLEAVRFDGNKAYAVTFLRVDPLFVIDVSDPANPAVRGALEVPGFSTHIEPRGDRLIAVGIDDTAGQRPAVAYYDVSDPANPSQLGRVILGPPNSFTDSDAVYDEKAFKIIDALGMIVIPFNHYEYTYDDTPVPPSGVGGGSGGTEPGAPVVAFAEPASARTKCTNGVQIVDFSDTSLTQRGWFDARARVNRVGVVGERLFALSEASLQTINIADRDHPALAGEAQFHDAAGMAQFEDCGGYYYGGPFIDPGFPDFVIDEEFANMTLGQFASMLRDAGMCGAGAAVPMMALVGGLMFVRSGRRRRR